MAVYSSYLPDYHRFYERSTSPASAVNFLESKASMWGVDTKHYISIGSSDGRFDREVITKCLPHLKTYEAVDIDPDALDILKDKCSTSEYKVITHCSNADDWTGPENNADVITLNHVLYYVTDAADLLNKCMTWLRPKGCMIILLCDENAFPKEIRKGEFKEKNDYSKVRDWIKTRQEKNTEYRLEGISNMVGLEHTIANFVMGRHLEDVEMKEVTDNLMKQYGDLSRLPSADLMWMIWKA